MPRVSTSQTNFTAGELTPKALGRADVAKYQNGAKSLKNCLVDIYGGASRAPGTAFVGAAYSDAHKSRLAPFIYNRSTAYHIEFAHQKVRFLRAGAGLILSGGVPYEIDSPYSEDDLPRVRYAQKQDTMFLTHPSYPMQTLRRLADDSWTLMDTPFSVLPFDEIGAHYATTLTLSDPTVGSARTVTASAATFLAADVGRRITYLAGSSTITAVGSATSATVDVDAEFTDTTLPASQWVLEDSPRATLTPSAAATVGQTVTLTLSAAGWRADDVGKYVKVNDGLVLITTYTSATVVKGICKGALSSAVAAIADSWKLQASVWNDLDGYPSAVCINQQRLVAGGTTRFPNSIWGSRSALYLDFTSGSDDGDAYSFALDGEANGIEHLVSMRVLIALTPGTEWTLTGGSDGPITPTSVSAKDQSIYGAANARPVRVGSELLFVQRAGAKVYAMAYNFDSDSYKSSDLTKLAEHITRAGVVEMAYQQEPGSIVWCVLDDGTLASLTIQRDEDVIAWMPHVTDGVIESVSCAPAGTADEVLVTVLRTVDGVPRRYIERLDDTMMVHSGITGTSVDGDTVWAGLDHLEGKTVAILADGIPQEPIVVDGGQITLTRPAYAVQAGLPCVPEVELLPPEISTPTGTAQSAKMRAHKHSLLFLETPSAEVNGKRVPFRQFGSDLLDQPPPSFTGWKSMGDLGWADGDIPALITQPDPLPFHLLAVVRHWTTNE